MTLKILCMCMSVCHPVCVVPTEARRGCQNLESRFFFVCVCMFVCAQWCICLEPGLDDCEPPDVGAGNSGPLQEQYELLNT